MANFKCSICNQDKPQGDVIKLKNSSNVVTLVCEGCRPDLKNEIDLLTENPRIKLKNPPIKKV